MITATFTEDERREVRMALYQYIHRIQEALAEDRAEEDTPKSRIDDLTAALLAAQTAQYKLRTP